MQKITLRYRTRKGKTKNTPQEVPPATSSNAVLHPPPITSSACDDNGLSQPLMVTSWVRDSCFQKTLLDGGSLVELINRKLVMKMRPRHKIFSDSRIKVSLANDSVMVLSEYFKIPVNVQEVEAMIRAWLLDVGVYDLLLGIPSMRRVNCTQIYGEGKVTIMGNDRYVMDVPLPIIPIDMPGLPTIEFDEDEMTADQVCQSLLDEQGKVHL